MRGSSSEDDGSEDDDVLASLRGDFADPFQRATARSEADRERDEADEEDERLIGDVAALAEVGDSDDDMDDDALAEEALALAGTRGPTADARWDDDSEDEEEEEEEEQEAADLAARRDERRDRTNPRANPTRPPKVTPSDTAGSGSRALRAYQTSRLAGRVAAARPLATARDGEGGSSSAPPGSSSAPPASGFGAGALPAWARPPLQRALVSPAVRDDDVADALTANRALQRRVRAVIREVEADLAANAEARAELADALRARRGKRGADGFGNDANEGDHDTFAEVLGAMRPGRSYFRVLPGVGREKRRKKNTAFATDANVAADLLKNQTEEDGGLGPRLNRDAARVAWREIRAAVPVTFEADYKPWTEKDDARLRRGVHHYTQQARVFSRERLTLAEVAGVGAASLESLLDDAGGLASVDADADAIDWAEVCAVHLPRRDPADAKARWRNCRDPRLEQRAFDEAEDDRLARIAKRFGARDWPAIARAFNDETRRENERENEREHTRDATFSTTTNDVSSTRQSTRHRKKLRSATQCAGRYQAFLNPDLVRSSWTEAEDAILRRHVAERGAGRWAEAARALPGHTHQQALHRWTKVLCPGRRKGHWRPEEDEALRFAVAAHAAVAEAEAAETRPAPAAPASGGKRKTFFKTPRDVKVFLPWSKIAARVATRTDVQCRERWTNVLDPARAAGKARAWTAAEDARLEAAVRRRLTTTRSAGDESAEAFETTVAWAQVARDMGDAGLTDKLCRNRHIILRRAAAKAAREAAKGAEKAAAKAAKAAARAAAKAEKAAAKAEARAAAKAEKAAAKAARTTGKGGKRAGSTDARAPAGKRRAAARG